MSKIVLNNFYIGFFLSQTCLNEGLGPSYTNLRNYPVLSRQEGTALYHWDKKKTKNNAIFGDLFSQICLIGGLVPIFPNLLYVNIMLPMSYWWMWVVQIIIACHSTFFDNTIKLVWLQLSIFTLQVPLFQLQYFLRGVLESLWPLLRGPSPIFFIYQSF